MSVYFEIFNGNVFKHTGTFFVLGKSNKSSMIIQFGDILLSSALLSNVLVKALPFLKQIICSDALHFM